MWTELKKIGLDIFLFLAGASGVFVSEYKKPNFIWWRFAMGLIAGGLSAMYITPVFVEVINVGHNGVYGIAYAIGFTGTRSTEWLVRYIQNTFDKKSK